MIYITQIRAIYISYIQLSVNLLHASPRSFKVLQDIIVHFCDTAITEEEYFHLDSGMGLRQYTFPALLFALSSSLQVLEISMLFPSDTMISTVAGERTEGLASLMVLRARPKFVPLPYTPDSLT